MNVHAINSELQGSIRMYNNRFLVLIHSRLIYRFGVRKFRL